MSAAARLRPLHRACDLMIATGDAELVQMGTDFARWLEGGAGTIEDALGVPDLGMVRVAASFEARNRAVCEMARRFGFRARKIAALVLAYEQTDWPADAAAPTCPTKLIGTPQEFAWYALRARPHPVTERQVRDILKNGSHVACDFR